MMNKPTSDERLLKLIEGSNEPKNKQFIATAVKKPTANFMPAKFNFVELKSKFKGLKASLVFLNKGLIGLAFILTTVFLYTIFTGPVIPKSNAAFFAPADAAAVAKTISSPEAQGLMRKSISSQEIKRNIFLTPGSKIEANTESAGPDLTEQVKDFKLVGIIWSRNPEAMIESAKDLRTYTLKKGDSLSGQLKVKEVLRNSAILEVVTASGSKEYELR